MHVMEVFCFFYIKQWLGLNWDMPTQSIHKDLVTRGNRFGNKGK